MIAFKCKNMNPKENQMLDKLKPYFNRVKIAPPNAVKQNMNKISFGESEQQMLGKLRHLKEVNQSQEEVKYASYPDNTTQESAGDIVNAEEITPLKERPKPSSSTVNFSIVDLLLDC